MGLEMCLWLHLSLAPFNIQRMQSFFFAIGHFLQATFNALLVPGQWGPVWLFIVVLAFGAVYWMNAQAKYTRRAKERKEYI
jgi:hypothetical protein